MQKKKKSIIYLVFSLRFCSWPIWYGDTTQGIRFYRLASSALEIIHGWRKFLFWDEDWLPKTVYIGCCFESDGFD
ncbi:hypothetical protein O6P43_030013 [Quillaja saponaria]|uniref:Uncharacterized protein n=1 Tax=Quillaja saponaria TaxID=32244 RepID=A0AAD7PC45_QUISA|nr:hypothetical protein O6P43_030013 [Quillaja saponaria]